MICVIDEKRSKDINKLELAYEQIPYVQDCEIKHWMNCNYNFIEYAKFNHFPNNSSWELLNHYENISPSGDKQLIIVLHDYCENKRYAIIHQFHEGFWLKKVIGVVIDDKND